MLINSAGLRRHTDANSRTGVSLSREEDRPKAVVFMISLEIEEYGERELEDEWKARVMGAEFPEGRIQ